MAGPSNPGVLGRFVNALAGRLGGKDGMQSSNSRVARLGLSPRQQMLNSLWAVYKCQQYEARKIDWNGRENVSRLDSEVISTQGFVPPGFYDVNGKSAELPLKFRRPTAPYALVTVIVNRFTGLLFSEGQHPNVHIEVDEKTHDFVHALADAGRLWQKMILARTYGGAMGSSAVGFQLVQGKPVFEVHNPLWCIPEFTEHGSSQLVSIEKRYVFPKDVQDPATGRWEQKLFWYRRKIDGDSDIVFQEVPVDDGEEPQWKPARQVDHKLGFCPVVWIQNTPVDEEIDGEPDCPQSVYDNQEAIDQLLAQAHKGTLANCDPTLVIRSDAEMDSIRKGSDNAIKTPSNGDAKYLEMNGAGSEAAMKQAESLKQNALEIAQCVLERAGTSDGKSSAPTATEVERTYQSMLAKGDILREQYGERGVKPLLEMAVRICRGVTTPKVVQVPGPGAPAVAAGAERGAAPSQEPMAGAPSVAEMQTQNDAATRLGAPSDSLPRAQLMSGKVVLPPKVVAKGVPPEQRELGTLDGPIELKWPDYFPATLTDVQLAVGATVAAMTGGVIDDETAIHFVAPYFKAEDKDDLVDKVRAAAAQRDQQMMGMALGAPLPPPGVHKGAPSGGGAGAPGVPIQKTATEPTGETPSL